MYDDFNASVRRSEIAEIIFLHIAVCCMFLLIGTALFSW